MWRTPHLHAAGCAPPRWTSGLLRSGVYWHTGGGLTSGERARVCGPFHLLSSSGSSSGSFVGSAFLKRVLLALSICCRHLGLFLGLLSCLLFLNGYCLPVPPTVVVWVFSGSFAGSAFLKRVCGPFHLLSSSGSSSGSFVCVWFS